MQKRKTFAKVQCSQLFILQMLKNSIFVKGISAGSSFKTVEANLENDSINLYVDSMKKALTILMTLTLVILTSGFIIKLNKDPGKIDKSPEFKKGTFWKNKIEQLTTYTGEKVNYTVNSSCYIDGVTKYKGIEVYETTYLIHEEHKIIKIFISKENLKIIDAIGLFTNYKDTITLEFDLLSFPLYKGKKWESTCKYQEFPKKPIVSYNSNFEVIDIKDSTFTINDKEVKTKAYFLKGELKADNKTSYSTYTYLAPTKDFPGTCPIFLWDQFFKDLSYKNRENKTVRKRTTTNYNW